MPDADTIQVSDHLKEYYSFKQYSRIYCSAEEKFLLDSIPIGTPFMVDTTRSFQMIGNGYWVVGKYLKENTWKKGYINAFDLADQYMFKPGDSTTVFLLGYEVFDTLYNYTCEVRICRNGEVIDKHSLGDHFYPDEAWTGFNMIDSLSDPDVQVINVKHEFNACGSLGDNYLLIFDGKLSRLVNYTWYGMELIDYEEVIYLTVNGVDSLLEMQNGQFTGIKYDGDIFSYMDQSPLLIKRIRGSNWADTNPQNKVWTVKEYVVYDLIYSQNNEKLTLIDSIHYDTATRFKIVRAEWMEENEID